MSDQNDVGNSAKCLVEALELIREKAMEHPCFMYHSFETRDYDAICDEGGDCCDWTFVGIYADDALREYNAQAGRIAGQGENDEN